MDNKYYTNFKNVTKIQLFFQNEVRFNRIYLFFYKQTINQPLINISADCAHIVLRPPSVPFAHDADSQLIAPQLMLLSRNSASLCQSIPNSGFSQLGSASMIF